MTPAALKKMAEGTVDAVKGYVARALDPLQKHVAFLATQRESADQLIEDLEARIRALERERDERLRA
jgi:hypothetical protein